MAMQGKSRRFRIWITRYDGGQPSGFHQQPPEAVAVEPAEPQAMTARQARRYVEAFNRAALAARRRLWAVAIPVGVRREGEPRSGELLGAGPRGFGLWS
jgi:hypothetical protein